MSDRSNLKKEAEMLEQEILFLEEKRSRSQASIMTAVLDNLPPDDADLQFFRMYTAEIDVKRDKMREINAKLYPDK